MEADYTDTYTTVLRNTSRMTAKDLFRMMFVYYPKPVQYLLRFRDWLVKPFGLQGGDGFTDLIKEKDEGQVTSESLISIWSFRYCCNVIYPMLRRSANPFG